MVVAFFFPFAGEAFLAAFFFGAAFLAFDFFATFFPVFFVAFFLVAFLAVFFLAGTFFLAVFFAVFFFVAFFFVAIIGPPVFGTHRRSQLQRNAGFSSFKMKIFRTLSPVKTKYKPLFTATGRNNWTCFRSRAEFGGNL
ncbi:MAG: hypothetical protein F3742_08135 [Nitrospinae bacterium]|nr:hypothetical protein [Nitrospinota bacterium]